MQATFTKAEFPSIIKKSHFFDETLNKNYLNVLYDNQGNMWMRGGRPGILRSFEIRHEAFRNITEITQQEKNERKQFLTSIQKEHYFQFNTCYSDLPISILHFQLRKNLRQLKNELFYSKKFGIESFDLVTHKQQTIYYFGERSSGTEIIEYDIKQVDRDYLIVLGRVDSVLQISKINYDDYAKEKRKKQTNNTPPFVSTVNISYPGEKELVNYVKFISNNRLFTTSNDCCFRIHDLNESNKVFYQVQNDSPINHCEFLEENNLLICVGDSTYTDIFDIREKKKIHHINANYDFGICIRSNPYNTNLFSTGNQDQSCKIWDIRNLNQSLHTLYGKIEAIGDVAWIDRNKICYAEDALYFYIYDMLDNKQQDFTFLGYFNGMVYDKKKEMLYISAQTDNAGGILCYEKIDGLNSLYDYDL